MPSVIETTYCEKHSIPSYHMDDDSVVHTCTACHPEIEEKPDTKFRITNYGAHDAAAGGFCDKETLELLKNGCTISIHCPPKAENDWYNDHYDLTGKECDGKFVYHAKDESKYWYSATISFNWKSSMIFNSVFKVRNSKNKKAIYSIALAGYLLANGLKVGKNG